MQHLQMLHEIFDHFQIWANNTQHVATRRNWVAKRTQHVAPNSVAICCVKISRHDYYPSGYFPRLFKKLQGRPIESYKNCEIYENCEIYDNSPDHLRNQRNLFKGLQGRPIESYENYEIYKNCEIYDRGMISFICIHITCFILILQHRIRVKSCVLS